MDLFDILFPMGTILYAIVFSALVTALASAAHGGEYASKGVVVALHILATPLVAPIFWLVFRRHKQAKAELDLLQGTGSYDAVVSAYYIRPLGLLMARVMRYCAEHPWPHFQPNGKRLQQELCGGFVVGCFIQFVALCLFLIMGL